MYFPFHRALIVFMSVACLAACKSTPAPPPVQGSPGIGDPYHPNLGNGGYEVQHYTIALNIDPPSNTITGKTTITARATEYLGTFNLDLKGLTVDSVVVNDARAEYLRNGDELTITPAKPLDFDKSFMIEVNYHGSPGLIDSQAAPFDMGWSHVESGVINVWGEPDAAAAWFPSNNHPRDKATFRFEITVPDPWIVAASGTLRETEENGDQTAFIWEMNQPMATYLASINIDQYERVTQSGPDGLTIRNYFPMDLPASQRIHFEILPAAIDFFDDLYGPYPFEEYGAVVAARDGFCATTSTALETQSMSLHCPGIIMTSERVIVHELAHQWFGDSVSLENWKDIWLKEGLATYSEWLWESKNDPARLREIAKNNERRFFDSERSVAEPATDHLYTGESYTGGALVFHALYLQVGDEAFFNILRTYTDRYRGGNAGTDELIALAEEVSGQDLDAFFEAWLFSGRMPDLPE